MEPLTQIVLLFCVTLFNAAARPAAQVAPATARRPIFSSACSHPSANSSSHAAGSSSSSSRLVCRVQAQETPETLEAQQQHLVGEDAAAFDWGNQNLKSWTIFGVLLTGVLAALYVVGDCALAPERAVHAEHVRHAELW